MANITETTTTPKIPDRDASTILSLNREQIIRQFEERIRADVPAARGIPHPLLKDSLPDWLEQVIESLASPDASFKLEKISKAAKKHGRQRIDLNFNINALLYEYVILRQVIFDTLEKEHPISPRQRDIILDAIQLSSRKVTTEYTQFLGRTRELNLLALVKRSFFKKYAATALIVLLATAIQWLVWPLIKPLSYFFYYPAVVVSCVIGDGLFAILLSIFASQLLFSGTLFSLRIATSQDAFKIASFAITTLLITQVTERLRKRQLMSHGEALMQEMARRQAQDSADSEKLARAESEEHLRLLKQERELRERFVFSLSHDLKGPLTAAKANLQLLQRRSDDATSREKFLARLNASLDRANQMIENLLDANRIRAGKKLPIEIVPLDLVQITQNLIEELSVSKPEQFLLTAPSRIEGFWSLIGVRRMLENLCDNAVKYGNPNQPIHITLKHEAESVIISVHNFGSYIPPDEQDQLFQIFRRGPSAERSGQKGWGIGLTIVEGIAEAHFGKVEVESSQEGGTTFIVKMPIDARPKETLFSRSG